MDLDGLFKAMLECDDGINTRFSSFDIGFPDLNEARNQMIDIW